MTLLLGFRNYKIKSCYSGVETDNRVQKHKDESKNLLECRDGMPKSKQQCRDDMKVKLNIQSPIPILLWRKMKG